MEASPRINPDYLINHQPDLRLTEDLPTSQLPSASGFDLTVEQVDAVALPADFRWSDDHPEKAAWVDAVKRGFDIVVSVIALVILSPVYLAVALAIKATTPGPVLFGQDRTGLGGKPFRMYKFRSMIVDAEQRLGEMQNLAQAGHLSVVDAPAFKSPDDPRITKIGGFLRRTTIDELPQLINILRGDMTFVGPRPLVGEEVAVLPPVVRALRHSVRPGLTCKWQVERTSATTFDQRMNLDLAYVRERSTTLDFKLLAMTPIAVLRGEGSH